MGFTTASWKKNEPTYGQVGVAPASDTGPFNSFELPTTLQRCATVPKIAWVAEPPFA
jgi:hypothetical protein